ncbi:MULTISPECIES: hypothetical protein [unclassified Methylobacterium]|uniref:hypothetical protein n=1 Tax=unclassified Methylobacterium TaxID=2615210 RepID=UPI0013553C3F|nr:hypothetical protein [Methylobacterium sp. 2A]MWV24564.1 hypothetical protein [Methylobacterium sp. 2A]
MSGLKSRPFWRGVLQGLSGPGMLYGQSRLLDDFVEVGHDGVRLKFLGGHRSNAGSRRDAMDLAQALADAATTISRMHGTRGDAGIVHPAARSATKHEPYQS